MNPTSKDRVETVVHDPSLIREHVISKERDEYCEVVDRDIHEQEVRAQIQPIQESIVEPEVLQERSLRGEERLYEQHFK